MNLIDFLSFAPLEELRREMGASLVSPISEIIINGLDEHEIRAIGKEGIEIESLDILDFHDDKTLLYKNTRVMLYIRDWSFSNQSNKPTMPRFHICNCATIQKARESGRSARYVIATREDGIFIVNKTNSGIVQKGIEAKLDICKNCLSDLNWSGYTSGGNKVEIFNHFEISDFFKKYPKSLLAEGNRQKDDVAPINNYPLNWSEISRIQRELKNWACERCEADMKLQKDSLHVHHIDGMKNNNNPSNLKVLCKWCHAKEPRHEHLR
jgi:HNH endonuclease